MNLSELKKIISEEVVSVVEAFEFNYDKIFIPPVHVASVAKNALGTIAHNDLTTYGGNEGSGKEKAKTLSERKPYTHGMMKRLKAYFDKNLDTIRQERNTGKNISNSGVIQVWELHGGDAGMKWVNGEIAKHNDSNLRTKKNIRQIGGAGINKGMGTMDVTMMDPTKQRIHR